MAEGSRVQRPALILSFNALCDTVGRNGLAPACFTFLINEHVCATAEKVKTPRERNILYSFGHKELRDFGACRAHRISARFVQHGP